MLPRNHRVIARCSEFTNFDAVGRMQVETLGNGSRDLDPYVETALARRPKRPPQVRVEFEELIRYRFGRDAVFRVAVNVDGANAAAIDYRAPGRVPVTVTLNYGDILGFQPLVVPALGPGLSPTLRAVLQRH